jgi:hypothetical protein
VRRERRGSLQQPTSRIFIVASRFRFLSSSAACCVPISVLIQLDLVPIKVAVSEPTLVVIATATATVWRARLLCKIIGAVVM